MFNAPYLLSTFQCNFPSDQFFTFKTGRDPCVVSVVFYIKVLRILSPFFPFLVCRRDPNLLPIVVAVRLAFASPESSPLLLIEIDRTSTRFSSEVAGAQCEGKLEKVRRCGCEAGAP